MTPERIELLLATGQADAAAAELGRLRGEPRAVALAKARVLAGPPGLRRRGAASSRRSPHGATSTSSERGVVFAWAWAHDDAARVDTLTLGASLAPGTTAPLPDLLAAGRLAVRACCTTRAPSRASRAPSSASAPLAAGVPAPAGPAEEQRLAQRSAALSGMAQVLIKRRDYDGALARLTEALEARASSEALTVLIEALHPARAHRRGHHRRRVGLPPESLQRHGALLPRQRLHAEELHAAAGRLARGVFADAAGRRALARADSLLAAGDRAGARARLRGG